MVVQVQTNAKLWGVLMVVSALAHSNIQQQSLRFKTFKRNAVVYCSLYDLEVQIICLCSDQRYCPNKSPDLVHFLNL